MKIQTFISFHKLGWFRLNGSVAFINFGDILLAKSHHAHAENCLEQRFCARCVHCKPIIKIIHFSGFGQCLMHRILPTRGKM